MTVLKVRKKEGWGYSHGDDRDPKFSPSSLLDSDSVFLGKPIETSLGSLPSTNFFSCKITSSSQVSTHF